jgi:hypothetical protein
MGSESDARRTESLKRLLDRNSESAVLGRSVPFAICFLPGNGPGVLSGELAILDANDSDFELAARLAHLLVHRRDNLGPSCARGLAIARESEREARLLESRLRTDYGLSSVVSTDDAERDYRLRCSKG